MKKYVLINDTVYLSSKLIIENNGDIYIPAKKTTVKKGNYKESDNLEDFKKYLKSTGKK